MKVSAENVLEKFDAFIIAFILFLFFFIQGAVKLSFRNLLQPETFAVGEWGDAVSFPEGIDKGFRRTVADLCCDFRYF